VEISVQEVEEGEPEPPEPMPIRYPKRLSKEENFSITQIPRKVPIDYPKPIPIRANYVPKKKKYVEKTKSET